MKIKIEEIKKYRNNNLKIDCKFFELNPELYIYSDTFVSITFEKYLTTIHAKTQKLKINSDSDFQKAELGIVLKREQDIEIFLAKILPDFKYNFFDFITFAYGVYSEFDVSFTLMDKKEIDYRAKLLQKIHGLCIACGEYVDRTKEEVKKEIKKSFGIESFKDLSIDDLETVYSYTINLTKEAEKTALKNIESFTDKEDIQIPY